MHAGTGRRARARGAAGHASPPRPRARAPAAASSCSTASPGPWLPPGFEVIPQRGDGLAERLAAAFEDVGEPAFLVGMDTPQVTPELLDAGLRGGGRGRLGVRPRARRRLLGHRPAHAGRGASSPGVPMSTDRTGAVQRARMAELGLDARRSSRRCATSTRSRTRCAVAAEAPRHALRRRARRIAPMAADRGDRVAIDGRARRVDARRARAPADALYGRLLASAASTSTGPARRRARGSGSPTGALEPLPLDRWLAPADAADQAILADVEAPVLDLGCGPGRHLAALRALGKRGLGVDLSPVAVRARARARRRRRSTARCGRACPARGGRSCCWTATSASAAKPVALLGGPASCSRRGGAIVVETDPPGAPTQRDAGPDRGAGRGVGVVPLGAGRARRRGRRSPRGRGSRSTDEPGARAAARS